MRLLSPPGLAGIAVVLADPDETVELAPCLRRPDGGALVLPAGAPPRRAAILIGDRLVDDVLALVRRDGSMEIHVHGSPAVLDQLDQHFGLDQASPASPAELLLGQAMSVEQLDLAVEQLAYDFASCLLELRALPPDRRAVALAAARERSRRALALAVPQRLVLIGRQNAGKSSLFNRLLFRERALTGTLPGLTRDPIAECTVLSGYPYELVDTAGEGEAAGAVDAAAIARGRAAREGAIAILLVDGARGPDEIDRQLAKAGALVIGSKADLPAVDWPADVPRQMLVSAVQEDAARIRARVGELLASHRGLPAAGAVGGFAALTPDQWQQLIASDGDCSPGASPA